jgi:hypothetical protein
MSRTMPQAINAELTQLKQLTDNLPTCAERAGIHQHLRALLDLVENLQLSASRAVFTLSSLDDGMEGLIDLLQQAEDKPVPANQLSGLLAPLHRQLQYANSETSHLLYDLLDDIRAYSREQSRLLLDDESSGNTGNRPLAG